MLIKLAIILFVLFTSFWTSWQWFFLNTFDSSAEYFGLYSLLSVAIFICTEHLFHKINEADNYNSLEKNYLLRLSALFYGFYILSLFFSPHLIQAIFMVTTLFTITLYSLRIPSCFGIYGLMILSLPLMSSLNFFLGFPLRILTTLITSKILYFSGINISSSGTLLILNNQVISIDAPCSGVNTLWTITLMSCLSMCFFRLNLKCSFILTFISSLIIIFSNCLRIIALFYMKILFHEKLVSLPNWSNWEPYLHLSTGITAFIFSGAILITLSYILSKYSTAHRISLKTENTKILKNTKLWTRNTVFVFLGISIFAVLIPFFAGSKKKITIKKSAIDIAYIQQLSNKKLIEIENNSDKNEFMQNFPGEIHRYTDGKKSYLIRIVNSATRQLHPSSECFKGSGFQVTPGPLLETIDKNLWSSFIATKQNKKFKIREIIYDKQGNSWTDVSDWYWSTLLKQTKAPWFDIVIIEQI